MTCQSEIFRGVLSRTPGHLTPRVNKKTPMFKALNILGRISSPSAACSVVTSERTSAALMVFYYPKLTSCVSDGARVTSKTPFWSFIDLTILWFFATEVPQDLSEHFVGLPVTGIKFIPEIAMWSFSL